MNLPYLDKADPWSSHGQIVEKLRGFPPGTTVLDIGAASGTIGRLCQGMGLIFKGIEPNENWAALARPYYAQVITTRIEEAEEAFLQADVIILADVLEHTPEPEKILAALAALQKPGSVFLISVPNVANLWVRANLLLGRFDYTDRGILDRTHLRFFTRSSFIHLLQTGGLTISALSATPIPLNLLSTFYGTHPAGKAIHGALAKVTCWLPTLLGYQFLAYTSLPAPKSE